MGIPRFGELVRRRYPQCWFNQGEVDVFQGLKLNLGGKVVEVDTLYVDGNGLLHPAMQFTFAYGSFEDERRKAEIQGKGEDQLIREGANFFMNAIKALCIEFRPKRLVLAIDGSAPIAKMIQQRQRRFGAKMDLSKDGSLTEAWKVTLAKNLKIAVQREESFVNIKILHNTSLKDGGQSLLETRLSELVEGSSAKKIFDMVSTNLVEYSAGLKLRWYNLLDPETPLGFEYEGRGWYSLAAAASALAFQDEYRTSTWADLLSTRSPEALVVRLDANNRFIYTNGKILNGEEQKQMKKFQDDYKDFKERNKDFFLTKSSSIVRRLKQIVARLGKTHPIYSDILLRTGVGTNLVTNDGQSMTWLMEIRTGILQDREREYNARKAVGGDSKAAVSEEIDYPDYEGGFRGVEGVVTVGKFDSNSLTPGTSVMEAIDRVLQSHFRDGTFEIADGIRIEVEYSGHRVPGEGEHKIMNLIDVEKRSMRGKTSLVYGLDADLFMLSMVRDHPLCLIRENVFHKTKFFGLDTRKNKNRSSCHVVDIENLKQSLSINGIHPQDFTLLCFLFGNDFLRNVPGFVFDQKMQVVMDPKMTREDEGANPVLFDYLFTNTVGRKTHYSELRERKIAQKLLREQEPMLVRSSVTPLKVRWIYLYELMHLISKDENRILDGMVRRMDSEIQLERQMKEEKPDYVPVNLRYRLLLESRTPKQVVVGGPLEQKGVLTTDFRYDEFKGKWTSHLTSNIPGYRTDGTAEGLTRDKKDVLRQICQTYLEGMEWAIKYYTNNHYLPTKGEMERRSILNNRWYYPYSHAPLISQLRDHLFEFLQEDARRMFVLEVERLNIRSQAEVTKHVSKLVRVLFSGILEMGRGFGEKERLMKMERNILDLLPEDLQSIPSATLTVEGVSNLLWNHYRILRERELKTIPSVPQYIRSLEGMEKGYAYLFENTFSSGWSKPRSLYGPKNSTMLAPSTTNFRVQLLAVLPQQSYQFFPDGASPADPEISWMYPETISVDFTFRDRVHGAILQLPPPNLPVLESYLSEVRVRNIEKQIGDDVFPPIKDASWAISETVLRKRTSYEIMFDYVREFTDEYMYRGVREGICVDVFAGVGISTMAASDRFERVVAFEPDRQNFKDLERNMKIYTNSDKSGIELRNEFFDLDKAPENATMYIFDYPVAEPRKKTDTSTVTVKTDALPGKGVPIEAFLESLIEKFERGSKSSKLIFLIKLPFFKKIGKIHTTLTTNINYSTESADTINYKVCKIVVSKQDGGYGGYGGEGYGYTYGHGAEDRPEVDGGQGYGYGAGIYGGYGGGYSYGQDRPEVE